MRCARRWSRPKRRESRPALMIFRATLRCTGWVCRRASTTRRPTARAKKTWKAGRARLIMPSNSRNESSLKRKPAVEIWDLHSHISGLPGGTPDERMVQLIKFADRMGIARLCVYMGMNLSFDPTPGDFRKQNDEVLQALSHWHHRAFGFVYVNPKHVKESLAEIDRCIRDGPMVGIKLWVALRANNPELDPIIERATELKAVVFQHTWLKIGGNFPGESTPMDLAGLAARHPRATIICGHTGGDWERGIRVVRAQ